MKCFLFNRRLLWLLGKWHQLRMSVAIVQGAAQPYRTVCLSYLFNNNKECNPCFLVPTDVCCQKM